MSDVPSTDQLQRKTNSADGSEFDRALLEIRDALALDAQTALNRAEELLQKHPDPRLFRLAAQACRLLDLADDAIDAELAAIQASLSDSELQRAATAQGDGRHAEALEIAEGFLRNEPDDLLALTIVAEALISSWELARAEEILRRILERAPTFLRASMLLATCLVNQLRMRDALAVLTEVVARKPNNVSALMHLAQLQAEVRDLDDATRSHERLTALEPVRPERWINLGQHYRMIGQRRDSIEAFRRALQIYPANGRAWWSLANYFPDELGPKDERAIQSALIERSGKPDEGMLHLAIGLLADRAKQYSDAFDRFTNGKRLQLAAQPYDPTVISTAIDHVISTFSRNFYEARSRLGWADDAPIFVLGMPRSGTTLIERVLGRHSAIEAAGELQIIRRLAEESRRTIDNPHIYGALLEELPDAEVGNLGGRYIRSSRDYRRTDKPRFVDKNNLNWIQVALILIALPNAKIIDARRNAVDCCWANFKMLFAEGFPAANHLRHVGRFYADYVRLFDHMESVVPERILRIRYEDLVDDLESETRRMLTFAGLPFEADCLDFHLSTDAVATPSSEQVRQPINRKGIGSADPYRPWLGPLIEELGALAEA